MFNSPHPSSPWATLDASAFVYDAASPTCSVWSEEDDDESEAVSVPTLAFFKPVVRARLDVDYFSFQPHGVRSPYLPEDFGRLEEEALFEFDDEELADEDEDNDDVSSVASSASTSIEWDAAPEYAFGSAFDDEESTPVPIERVSVFDLSPPALSALSSSASSSSSSSSIASIRTPLAASLPSVSPPKRVAPTMSLTTAVGSLISYSRRKEKAVHADTPAPAVVESPGTTTALFNWRRE